MDKLKIWFDDMWGYSVYQFNPRDNYFFNLLSLKFELVLDQNNPDLLIFSCFGNNHFKYKCKKLYYTAENLRPFLSEDHYDVSLTFHDSIHVSRYRKK